MDQIRIRTERHEYIATRDDIRARAESRKEVDTELILRADRQTF